MQGLDTMRAIRNAAVVVLVLAQAVAVSRAGEEAGEGKLVAVPFSTVKIRKGFWRQKLNTNRDVTVWYDFRKCEETGRIDNFAKAGGLMQGGFRGIFFNDSDVYKVIEGAAYSLAIKPDVKLDRYLDQLIAKISAAQEPDGYLYTYRTLAGKDATNPATGRTRWSHLQSSHELYNVGHLYEAAVAYYQATGKRSLLDVAIKNADLICRTFGPDKIRDVPGHEEIELGLVKLYRITGQRKYLKLAEFFLDERGHAHGRALYGPYLQDHQPVVEQTEAVGHAVRAGYLYTAVADVAALTRKQSYIAALDKLWSNVVAKKLYLTGGIGAHRRGEAFGDDYELPNRSAYCETCAAIANALWNQRMFLLHRDAKYIDVLERIIYNGFLSGVSLSGDRFFYPNPLEHDGYTPFNHGASGRSPWFGTSCCPVNIVRFLPSIGGSIYAHDKANVYVNLFLDSESRLSLDGRRMTLSQHTDYPWDGQVQLEVKAEERIDFALHVRIPGWSQGRPVPSDLYRYLHDLNTPPSIEVNGEPVAWQLKKGFAVVRRHWTGGDTLRLKLAMPIRRAVANPHVEADTGRVAIERGPVVYCVEAVDHGGSVFNLSLPDEARLSAEHRADLLGGVTVVKGRAVAKRRDEQGHLVTEQTPLLAIPYYAWANRQVGEMIVWLPRDPALSIAPRAPSIASRSTPRASHVCPRDVVTALNDQREPANSYDQSLPRFTWWDHRGTKEWVQYDFAEPVRVEGVAVYWYDDTGHGLCRVPQSWRILYRDAEQWKPVADTEPFTAAKDRFNQTKFAPLETSALRIEVQLQPDVSGGILEWKVLPADGPSSTSRG